MKLYSLSFQGCIGFKGRILTVILASGNTHNIRPRWYLEMVNRAIARVRG